MSDYDVKRDYLKGRRVKLNALYYTCCLNQRCHHTLINGHPSNTVAERDDAKTTRDYIQLCEAFKKFKKSQGPELICPNTGSVAPGTGKLMSRISNSKMVIKPSSLVPKAVGQLKAVGNFIGAQYFWPGAKRFSFIGVLLCSE